MGHGKASGGVSGGSLDTEGTSTTPPPSKPQVSADFRRERRAQFEDLKRVQRRITVLHSAALCMFGRAEGTAVQIDVGAAGIAHVSGVHRCGSPWACPLCAPVIRQQRAMEIDQALAEALHRGWTGLFVTSTLRHSRRDTLSSRLDVVAELGNKVRSGEPWKRRRDRLGYRGVVQAVETTWSSRNGWHPHGHGVWLFDRALSAADVADFAAWCFGRMDAIATRRGLGTLDRKAFDVQVVGEAEALSDYLVKIEGGWSPGLELARSDVKHGAGSLTPFQLLGWLVATGEAKPYRLWQEYERATKGKPAVRFSPGLRGELLGDDVGATDEELAAAEDVDLALLRCLVAHDDWNRLVAQGRRAAFLGEVEDVALFLMMTADLLGLVLEPLDLRQEVTL